MITKEFYEGLEGFINSLSDKRDDKKILDYVMDEIGHIPKEVQRFISDKTGMFEFSIKGTIDFYPNLKESLDGNGEPTKIRVCTGMTCGPKGGKQILEIVKNTLGIDEDETTLDGRFTLERKRCFGQCAKGPNVYINDEGYHYVEVEDIERILKGLGL